MQPIAKTISALSKHNQLQSLKARKMIIFIKQKKSIKTEDNFQRRKASTNINL
jgi:hypothetical protein